MTHLASRYDQPTFDLLALAMAYSNNNHPQTLDVFSQRGDIEGVARLLALSAYTWTHATKALWEAAHNGHAGCVSLLIPVSDPKANNSEALREAALNGHAECVKLLIPFSDPKAHNSQALRRAARSGHAECVKLLIPVSDPKAAGSLALRWAANNGRLECAKLLLPASAPLIELAGVLTDVLGSGHAKVLGIMLAHEPRLLEWIDLAESLYAASAQGHSELEYFLRSIIDQRSIVEHLDAPKALNAPAPRRL